jgi:Ca2+/H+ antiporter
VFLPLLYLCGLVFSLNSHYKLIEDEEKLIHQEIQERERLSLNEANNSNQSLKEVLLTETEKVAAAEVSGAALAEAAADEIAVVNFR